MKAKWMDIDPDLSGEFLERNRNIRNLDERRAKGLAMMMERGEWRQTHQGIAFDRDGYLVDGQHRLRAIQLSGTTQRMLVVSGLESDDAIDSGIKRTMAVLTGHDKPTCSTIHFCLKQIGDGYDISASQIKTLIETTQLGREIKHYSKFSKKKIFGSAPFISSVATCVVTNLIDRTSADKLFRDLATHNYETLPPIGKSLIKQIAIGTIEIASGHRPTNIARFIRVFTAANANLETVRISPAYTEQANQWFRDVIREQFATDPVSKKRKQFKVLDELAPCR